MPFIKIFKTFVPPPPPPPPPSGRYAEAVRSLTFSVDSKTLFTACDDGHIHMYDVEHRSLMDALPGHKSWVLGVAAAPNGGALVSSSCDSTAGRRGGCWSMLHTPHTFMRAFHSPVFHGFHHQSKNFSRVYHH